MPIVVEAPSVITGTFTLTGRLVMNDATTPIAFAPLDIIPWIGAMPDPALNTVFDGTVPVLTNVNGQFSTTLYAAEDVYYTVRSADNQTNVKPTTFAAPTNGATLDLADIMSIIPSPILPDDAADLRAEFSAADSALEAELRADLGGSSGSGILDAKVDGGAAGDGTTDDTTELDDTAADAVASGKIMRIPKGSYLYSGTVYDVSGDWLWSNHGYTTSVNEVDSARKNNILVTAETANTTPQDPNESRVAISVTVAAKGAHHGTGVRSNLQNSSTDGNGCTAFYGSAVSDVDANWSAAVHGETRHGGGTSIGVNSESASYEATGTLYGLVVNNSTSGAAPTHPLTGASAVAATTAIGAAFKSSSISTAWVTGIDVSSTAIRTTGNVIKSAATPQRHFWATGASAVADIHLEGASDVGIILGADYVSGNAIRLKTGNRIAFESAGSITLGHAPTPNRLVMRSSGTERLSFEVSTTPKINISGTQVVGPQQTGWSAATGTGSRATFDIATVTTTQLAGRVKALIDDLIAHGLIGA